MVNDDDRGRAQLAVNDGEASILKPTLCYHALHGPTDHLEPHQRAHSPLLAARVSNHEVEVVLTQPFLG